MILLRSCLIILDPKAGMNKNVKVKVSNTRNGSYMTGLIYKTQSCHESLKNRWSLGQLFETCHNTNMISTPPMVADGSVAGHCFHRLFSFSSSTCIAFHPLQGYPGSCLLLSRPTPSNLNTIKHLLLLSFREKLTWLCWTSPRSANQSIKVEYNNKIIANYI